MKRFLFIFMFVVSLVLPAASSVYAAPYLPNFPETIPAIPDSLDYEYIIVIDTGDGSYMALGSTVPFLYDGSLNPIVPSSSENTIQMYQYLPSNGFWNTNYDTFTNRTTGFREGVCYSNHDIYYSGSSEIFFQLPQPVLGMEKEILVQVVTQENPLMEILTLLPMAIPFLVGFVALRKALRILETILRTA